MDSEREYTLDKKLYIVNAQQLSDRGSKLQENNQPDKKIAAEAK